MLTMIIFIKSNLFMCFIAWLKVNILTLFFFVLSVTFIYLVYLLFNTFVYLASRVKSMLNFSFNFKIVIAILVLVNKCVLIPIKCYIIPYSVLSSYFVLIGFILLKVKNDNKLCIKQAILVYIKALLFHLLLREFIGEPLQELFICSLLLVILFDKEAISFVIALLCSNSIPAIAPWLEFKQIIGKGVPSHHFHGLVPKHFPGRDPGPNSHPGAHTLDHITNPVLNLTPVEISGLTNRLEASAKNIAQSRGLDVVGVTLIDAINGMNITNRERAFLYAYFNRMGWGQNNRDISLKIIYGGRYRKTIFEDIRHMKCIR